MWFDGILNLWLWRSLYYLVKVTTKGEGGVKNTQNFDHVVYGWPPISHGSSEMMRAAVFRSLSEKLELSAPSDTCHNPFFVDCSKFEHVPPATFFIYVKANDCYYNQIRWRQHGYYFSKFIFCQQQQQI